MYDPHLHGSPPSRPTQEQLQELFKDLQLESWANLDIPPETEFLGSLVTNSTRLMLVGTKGLGKTNFAHGIAAGIASRRGFLKWRTAKAGRMLIIDGEMPASLLQKRAHAQLAVRDDSLADVLLFAFCRAEQFAARYPFLGSPEPLNTTNGQAFVRRLIDWFKPDVIIYDNVMSLLVGSQKEEEAWAGFAPFTTEVTNRGIGQIFLDHTGHDTSRPYGSDTKTWRLDTVGIMTPLPATQQREGELGFALSFDGPIGKARRREPDNWSEYEPIIVRFGSAGWSWEPASRRGRRDQIQSATVQRAEKRAAEVAKAVVAHLPELTQVNGHPVTIRIEDLVPMVMKRFELRNTAARDLLNAAIPEHPGRSVQGGNLWRFPENPNHKRSPVQVTWRPAALRSVVPVGSGLM